MHSNSNSSNGASSQRPTTTTTKHQQSATTRSAYGKIQRLWSYTYLPNKLKLRNFKGRKCNILFSPEAAMFVLGILMCLPDARLFWASQQNHVNHSPQDAVLQGRLSGALLYAMMYIHRTPVLFIFTKRATSQPTGPEMLRAIREPSLFKILYKG